MLEIKEVIPQYFVAGSEHAQTANPCYAKNWDAVRIFNEFRDTFFVWVDDQGRLVCAEKEEKEDKNGR